MTFWNGKRVLVTGATGLIGGHLCKRLLSEGSLPLGLDLAFPGTLGWHGISGNFPVTLGDIMNQACVDQAVKGSDVIFHLAAQSNVERSRSNGYNCFLVNILGTLNVLEAARRHSVPCIVASSNHIYGHQAFARTPEDAPLNQLDTYSASKACADILTRSYAHNYGVLTAAVRNTNCYGPCDPHKDHLIPGAILAVLSGKAPVIKNPLTRKSYLYVEDVAEAYLLIAQSIQERSMSGLAFNVSDDTSYSATEVVDSIVAIMGTKVLIRQEPKPTDQADEYLDNSQVRSLGWWPRHSLQMGLEKTVAWFKEQKE